MLMVHMQQINRMINTLQKWDVDEFWQKEKEIIINNNLEAPTCTKKGLYMLHLRHVIKMCTLQYKVQCTTHH